MNESLEYMAFGRPVIASDLHETHISTGDAAVYVKPNDVRDYAEAIASLLDDEDNRAGWASWGITTSSRSLPGVIRNVPYRGVYQRLTGGPKVLDRPAEV
jgi:glycosyltransferase involved in cell wall biosynthesis